MKNKIKRSLWQVVVGRIIGTALVIAILSGSIWLAVKGVLALAGLF